MDRVDWIQVMTVRRDIKGKGRCINRCGYALDISDKVAAKHGILGGRFMCIECAQTFMNDHPDGWEPA